MKIIILGGPKTGKSTLASKLSTSTGYPIKCTDALIGMEWSAGSQVASEWFDLEGNLIIEGTMTVRALRKWLNNNPTTIPKDWKVYYLSTVKASYDKPKGQQAMAASVYTIFKNIQPGLLTREIPIVYRDID